MRVFPPFRLDTVNQCLWRRRDTGDDERISLTPRAFGLLRYLVEHSGRLVTHEELLNALWPDTFVQPEVLKNHILDVRAALGDHPKNPKFIETLPKRGYQFIAPVREESGTTELGVETSSPKLVGRSTQLSELHNCMRRVLASQRQIVFITGEPGIGKTSLVDEFLLRAAIDFPDIRVARGQCVEGYGGKEAYYPILEAVGQICSASGGDAVVQALFKQAPTWLVQFPALVKSEQRETLRREILGATRERMLREIGEALETIASEKALLLVLEDLHWADASTVDLISSFARRRTPGKLLLIGTYRPVEVTLAGHPLKAVKQDLLIHRLCREIALDPLAETEVAELLAADCRGTAVPEGLAELIHRHTEGNPLFVVAALEHMTQRGFISREDGTWKVNAPLDEIDLQVPESLRQMIEIQIDRLSDEERQVLELASLESVGRTRFAVVARAAIGGLEPEAFEDVCEDLSRRHFILHPASAEEFLDRTKSACYEFVHVLYREVCYRRIVPGRRAKLHQRLGEWAETHVELSQSAVWLAGHFEQGGDLVRAVKYLRVAAETASGRFEARQAAEILAHALTITNKLPDEQSAPHEMAILDHLANISSAIDWSQAIAACETLVSKAARYGSVEVQVSALLKMAWLVLWVNPERCLKALQRAMELSDAHGDPLLSARSVLAWCLCNSLATGAKDSFVEDSCKAIEVVRQRADRLVLASSLIDYSHVQWLSSDYRAAHRNAVEGLTAIIAESGNNPYLQDAYLRQIVLPWSLLFLGRWGEAVQAIDSAAAIMERNEDHCVAQAFRLYLAWVHIHALDFAGVLRICEPTPDLFKDLEHYRCDLRFCLILIASAELNLGNYGRAQRLLSEVQEDMERVVGALDWYWRMPLESALTELSLAKGDLAQARRQVDRFVNITLASVEHTWQALAWEVNTRVAMAELDLNLAQHCIANGLSAMEGFEVPLAGWRIHATAAELCSKLGDRSSARRHFALSRETIMKLANSLPPEEPLREIFLSAPLVRKILGDSETAELHAKEA